jgi:hypothetical protein
MIKEQRDSGIITLHIAKSGQSGTKVLVRFMVGGPGWALHIRYQMEMAENRSTRRQLRREREDQGEESAPRRVRYEDDPELLEDSGPSTSAPTAPEEEPMETASSARSPDRASPPPLIDLESEPELPPSPRLIPEIERFMSSQPIFEDISEDESTPGTLPTPRYWMNPLMTTPLHLRQHQYDLG